MICSGTELLKDKLNSNSCLIADRLSTIGLSLAQVTTVGDVKSDLDGALRSALKRSDVVLSSGGLGPTFDDLTRDCVSRVLKKPLRFSPKIMAQIQRRFASHKLAMPKENELQAYVLKDAIPILNNVGTAPGQILILGKKSLVLLPGPPNELLPMMEGTVLPYLKRRYSKGVSETLVLHIFGYSESQIDEEIAPVLRGWQDAPGTKTTFGILAHKHQIDVKATVEGRPQSRVRSRLQKIRGELYEVLSGKVYGENEETLESVVGGMLKKRRESLALAESCTGGLIAHKITNVPGSSIYFKEGLITYSNESKMRLLGVRKKTLKDHGAVSEPVAKVMAEGARRRSGSDWAVSVTGIAGPGGGTKDKPIGLACYGIASTSKTLTVTKRSFGDRLGLKDKFALTALELFRKELLDRT